ncbi:MAG: GNAT family N-acetyltransferase [Rickettsiales bacterium]|jgi:ribosomal-protein-serine acetyltransferase|nr:GNAT family N-acetyltransferase [Rickettsiales bacterium]
MKNIRKILEGKNIELRTIEPMFRNTEAIFVAVDKNRDRLKLYFDWVQNTKFPEDSYVFLQTTIERRKKGTEFMFGIFVDDVYAGNIDMHNNVNSNNMAGETGYWLDKEFIGKGYVDEAVKLLENEFFDSDDGLKRIQISAQSKNEKSNAVTRKNNYILERTLKKYEFIDGQFNDCNIYSKLKEE